MSRIYPFLSTLSLRRATQNELYFHISLCDFYPRSPCGERPKRTTRVTFAMYFYPRSPCGERRTAGCTKTRTEAFLSTLSLRRATRRRVQGHHTELISIHALLAESDPELRCKNGERRYFYPRSPCGERHMIHPLLCNAKPNFYPRSPCGERPWGLTGGLSCDDYFYPRSPCGERLFRLFFIVFDLFRFLSTLSLRRATFKRWCVRNYVDISIHALLAESDACITTITICIALFLSTLSLRRATHQAWSGNQQPAISIHALLAESDQ